MENHEENNIHQEIIDSLAKQVTDLKKRQSKIEELDLNALPSKVENLETKVNETSTMKTLENTKQLEWFGNLLNGFDKKLDAIPKAIPVKHGFDPKSKFVIKIISGLGIAVAGMLAISISLWIENNRRADETNKILILRGFYPDLAKSIDSAYMIKTDSLINAAKTKIAEQQTMSQVAFEAQQAAKQSRLAKDKLLKLRRKRR